NGLLLVLGGSCCYRYRALRGALARKLSSVHSRCTFLDIRDRCADRTTSTLAQLGQAAHHRHGLLLHSDADRILCGQWQEPTALERASPNCVLVVACCAGNTAPVAHLVEASSGTPRNGRELRPHSLAKGWLAHVQAQVPGLAAKLERDGRAARFGRCTQI